MDDNSKSKELRSTPADYLTALARGTANLVPIVGPYFAEIIGVTIPNQRIDRVAKFATELERKIGKIEDTFVQSQSANEEYTDLVEEGFRQAARSLSDERRGYIASLIANSLSSEDIEYYESKHLLRILDQINDIEIIWLRFYREPVLEGDEVFRETHKEILESVPATINAPQEVFDKATLQDSYTEHLYQLGLLAHKYSVDHSTRQPEFDEWTGAQEVDDYEITSLGTLLLREIGL